MPTSSLARTAVAGCGLLAGLCAAPGLGLAASARPNVVVIVVDDMGYHDLSAYGGDYATPHIDALARDGVRFTQGYVTAAVCSPSRAGLLTGRHQQRFGHDYQLYSNAVNLQFGVDPGQPTIAKTLGRAGYATALFGKWHLGAAPERQPQNMGFQTFYGILGGTALYIDPDRPDVVSEFNEGERERLAVPTILSERRTQDGPVEDEEYLTEAITRRAVDYIEAKAGQPFLMVVTYTSPHTPLQATTAQLANHQAITDPAMRLYRTVIDETDKGVGRIRAQLTASGVADNTLIFLLSDNGCPQYKSTVCTNAPLNGFKRYLAEGGIRVPFMAAWPGTIPSGLVYERPISSLDILPTAAAAAGAVQDPSQPSDGIDLLPFLTMGRPPQTDRRLYWRSEPSYAIRSGDWKLLVNEGQDGKPVEMLFDLSKDPLERADLSASNADVLQRLKREWQDWSQGMDRPRWPTNRQFDTTINGVPVKVTN